MENLNNMTLSEAWHSERMKEIRQRHLQNSVKGLVCYNCIYEEDKEYEPINTQLFEESYIKD